ncbi:MAG: DUF2336 domain-containing protein [Rhodospirillales bacterium]|nr:DUF2336 domain-containing protein [Rhodospirillales bacterium]
MSVRPQRRARVDGGQPTTGYDANYLFELARERSAKSLARLTEIVVDLFESESTVLSDRERAEMYSILRVVIRDIEMSLRRRLSERLADLADVPPELVRDLANDAVDVAYPILTRCGVLRDEDLIEIVRFRSLEHQLAVAIRENVSEAVSEALVATNNERVIETLLRNENARISRMTLEYLVEESKRVDSFREPLLRREDLGADLARRMFAWVSMALRQYILDAHDLDPHVVDELLEAAAVEELRAHPPAKKKSAELAEALKREGRATPAMILAALREGEVSLFVAMFCRETGLGETLAKRVLFEPEGEGLAIACRAAGFGKVVFSSILALRRKIEARPELDVRAELRHALAFFDHVPEAGARDALLLWRQGSDYGREVRRLRRGLKRSLRTASGVAARKPARSEA